MCCSKYEASIAAAAAQRSFIVLEIYWSAD